MTPRVVVVLWQCFELRKCESTSRWTGSSVGVFGFFLLFRSDHCLLLACSPSSSLYFRPSSAEADGSDVDAEGLVVGADVVRRDVDDRQSDHLVRVVGDDSLGPRVGLGLAAVLLDGVPEAGLSVGRQLEVVGGEDLDGLVVSPLARVEVSDGVL